RTAFDDRAGETAEGSDRRELARQVDLALLLSGGLGGVAPTQPQTREADWQANEKDRAPAAQRDQSATDQRARREREAGAGGPDPHRATALPFIGIGVVQQRQRVRNQDRRAKSLNAPRRDKASCMGRQRTGDRRCREDGETRHEDPLRADTVAQR